MRKPHRIISGVRPNEKGAELVELAFIIPIFLVLLIGILEFGRAYNVYENVIHAAREGVRAAVADCLTGGNCTPGSASKLSDSEIRTRIRGHLQAINIYVPSDSDIIVSNANITATGFKDGNGNSYSQQLLTYNVRVNYTYNFLYLGGVIKLIAPSSTVGGGGLPLSATVEMRDETSAI